MLRIASCYAVEPKHMRGSPVHVILEGGVHRRTSPEAVTLAQAVVRVSVEMATLARTVV